MAEITSIAPPTQGSYLGTCELYRLPDGTISMRLTDMATWEIEGQQTIAQRFMVFAGWLREGVISAEQQALSWREEEEGYAD